MLSLSLKASLSLIFIQNLSGFTCSYSIYESNKSVQKLFAFDKNVCKKKKNLKKQLHKKYKYESTKNVISKTLYIK